MNTFMSRNRDYGWIFKVSSNLETDEQSGDKRKRIDPTRELEELVKHPGATERPFKQLDR